MKRPKSQVQDTKFKYVFRVLLIIIFLIPFFFYLDFYIHFASHFSGSIMPNIITDQWIIVILNIIIFLTFLIPLSFRRKVDWKEYGLVTAFFVSLFIEMYGLPLTVFFASKTFSGVEVEVPNVVYGFDFMGVNIDFSIAMLYGTLLMIIGTIIIVLGWVTLYKNLKESEVVTIGIYSYSRHPQYLGFILIIVGWILGWPTILTLIFAPILIFIYVRVCKIEENELKDVKGYSDYKRRVPFLL